jgi:hypothetical protein
MKERDLAKVVRVARILGMEYDFLSGNSRLSGFYLHPNSGGKG